MAADSRSNSDFRRKGKRRSTVHRKGGYLRPGAGPRQRPVLANLAPTPSRAKPARVGGPVFAANKVRKCLVLIYIRVLKAVHRGRNVLGFANSQKWKTPACHGPRLPYNRSHARNRV